MDDENSGKKIGRRKFQSLAQKISHLLSTYFFFPYQVFKYSFFLYKKKNNNNNNNKQNLDFWKKDL